MAERIRLAFIGSGSWAQRYHFPALDHIRSEKTFPATLNLRGIYSRDRSSATQVADVYRFDRVYDSLKELAADSCVDAVAIAVPPAALVEVIEQVLPMDVPILSEKPPGISFEQAAYLAEIVTVPNVVAFNRRFIPLNDRFKEIVDAMQHIFFVEGHFFRHDRHDPDFVLATGIHWINYMEYLFGEIHTVRNTRFPHPVNDTMVRIAELTFAGGLHGLIKFFPCTGSQGERLEVHSASQSAYLHGPLWDDPGEIVVESATEHEVLHLQRHQHKRFGGPTDAPEVVTRGIAGEYLELLHAVVGDGPTRSNFQNAVNSMHVAEAIEAGVDVSGPPEEQGKRL